MDIWSYEFIRRHQIEILEWAKREHESKWVLRTCPIWKPSFRLQLADALIRLGLRMKAAVPGTPVYPGGCSDVSTLSLRNT